LKKLKGPNLTVPPFVADLFYDLRDRRLLPLVAVVAVAIVAVPFLLGGGSKRQPPPPPPVAGAIASSVPGTAAGSARLTVVEAKPGLRDYRKRLSRRPVRNPFKQRYTGPVLKGAHLNPQTGSATTSTTTTTTTSSGGAGFSSPVSTSPAGGGGGKPTLTFFTFAIDVKISQPNGGNAGAETSSEPTTRHRVLPTTSLPGEKTPVVTYMGTVSKGTKALFLVSADVKSVFGDGKCVSGTADVCQLLQIEPGFPETFVYGPNDATYKVNVLKIEPVVTGHS
jgi:hypothetical protein